MFSLLLGSFAYLTLTSSSTGMSGVMGASTVGCGPASGGCHDPGTGTTITITGLPAGGYVAGTAYTLTLNVINSSKTAAGFDLTCSAGAISNKPANTMLMGTTELHHVAPLSMTSGTSSWSFTWTAPTTGTSVDFNVAGNAVNGDLGTTGDAYATTKITFNKAWAAAVNNVDQSEVQLYPNPANESIVYKSSNDLNQVSFSVVSINGTIAQVSSSKINSHEYKISTASLAAGNYILLANANGQKQSHLFTKQ